MPCPSAPFKKFWTCSKNFGCAEKFWRVQKFFGHVQHIFFFKFFPFQVFLHHIKIFWTCPKNLEQVQNFLTTFKIFWLRSKILDGADGPGISVGNLWTVKKQQAAQQATHSGFGILTKRTKQQQIMYHLDAHQCEQPICRQGSTIKFNRLSHKPRDL